MAIMDMVMALKNNKGYIAIFFACQASYSVAGDFTFTPALNVNETYTDNIDPIAQDKAHSYVTETSATLQGDYVSKNANFNLVTTHSYHMYSHNSDLNDNTRETQLDGEINLTNDLSVNASMSIDNINTNNAENGLDNLIIENTVEQKNYDAGINYNIENSTFSFSSSASYQITKVEDGIGESEGYRINYSTQNGTNARNIFWSSNGNYNDNKNSGNTGQNYSYEIKLGWILDYKITPFVRYFDEDSSGNISRGSNTTTKSWGPGIRWKVAKHLILDTSYNFVSDSSESDDYIDAQLSWQPSSRTNLNASYSERFYGEAYNVDFTHRSKRLTNSIQYSEDLTAFNRDTYELDDSGDLVLVENNEFRLEKQLSWQSTLSLARTTFDFSLSHRDSESLETNKIEEDLTGTLSANRRISRKSSLTFTFDYDNNTFNKDSTEGDEQVDYYRTYSAGYTRQLLHALSTSFNVEYVNRNSSTKELSYDEARAVLNISKEF